MMRTMMKKAITGILQPVSDRLPEKLRWRLWWLIRPKYLIGIFVAAIQDDQIIIIKKKHGVSTGWQLPGGDKDYGNKPSYQAAAELFQGAGISARNFQLVNVRSNEDHRDLHILFLTTEIQGTINSFALEIEKAVFIPIDKIEHYLEGDHLFMAREAIKFYYKTTEFFDTAALLYQASLDD